VRVKVSSSRACCSLRPYSHETFWHTILLYFDKKIFWCCVFTIAYLGCHWNPWLKNIFSSQYLFIAIYFYRNIFLSQYLFIATSFYRNIFLPFYRNIVSRVNKTLKQQRGFSQLLKKSLTSIMLCYNCNNPFICISIPSLKLPLVRNISLSFVCICNQLLCII